MRRFFLSRKRKKDRLITGYKLICRVITEPPSEVLRYTYFWFTKLYILRDCLACMTIKNLPADVIKGNGVSNQRNKLI